MLIIRIKSYYQNKSEISVFRAESTFNDDGAKSK